MCPSGSYMSWKGLVVVMELSGKGSLVCLDIGQTLKIKGCLEDKEWDKPELSFILTKGTCANL